MATSNSHVEKNKESILGVFGIIRNCHVGLKKLVKYVVCDRMLTSMTF